MLIYLPKIMKATSREAKAARRTIPAETSLAIFACWWNLSVKRSTTDSIEVLIISAIKTKKIVKTITSFSAEDILKTKLAPIATRAAKV